MKFGSLFAGIGGFDLGLERAGMECAWQVENNEWCQKILKKHWPDVPKYGDIRDVGKSNLEAVDLICGGFPCQPFSVAGKQQGEKDDRYLWPEMLRVISEVRPAWVIGENVTGIVKLALDDVLLDLENEGYTTRTCNIPACGVNAPHRRERIWILAYRNGCGLQVHEVVANTTNTNGRQDSKAQGRRTQEQSGRRTCRAPATTNWWSIEPSVGRVAHGVPSRMDRLRGLGNAVVPQVVEVIGRAIYQQCV